MRYRIIEKEPCCASQQNWPAHVRRERAGDPV